METTILSRILTVVVTLSPNKITDFFYLIIVAANIPTYHL